MPPVRSVKVITKHQNLHKITTWHSVYDDAVGQQLISLFVTLLLYLEEEFPRKQSTSVLHRLTFMPASRLVCPLDCIQKGKPDIVFPAGCSPIINVNIKCEYHKNGGVFF
ncbi:hypothetical protein TNCV_2864521 [Trichonephila clavipes]|nr:hypothetical protein TNCV_2864521 [Trichonephila clavipes]